MRCFLSVVLCAAALVSTAASGQTPRAEVAGIEVREVARIPQTEGQRPVRIEALPDGSGLYVLATSGRVYRIEPRDEGLDRPALVLAPDDHGTPSPVGMVLAGDGTLFLVGNENVGADRTAFVIRRGTPTAPGSETWDWSTVATSEPYLLSRTWFDHKANGVALSPDGSTLYVNSGARTDHGEMYGGVREEGLTAIILQIPADATDLTLPNDRQSLKDGGYVFAEGIRNSFDLTIAPNGDLLAPENAGDRDDSEELNWIREGHHYGFPWRIGTSTTPMQFAGYDPSTDPFVQPDRNTDNQADTGWYFSDDPTYPAPPAGVTFTDPIPNVGPFADHYREPGTGTVLDASDEGTSLGTFTSHRSPLGLAFDADSLLAGALRGGGLMVSWNDDQDQLLQRMRGTGEDLVLLDLDKSTGEYTVSTRLLVSDFDHPIDAAMIENVLYVIEYGNPFSAGGRRSVQAVTLPRDNQTTRDDAPDAGALMLTLAPNPTAGSVSLRYVLSSPAEVRLELVDALGRVVRVVRQQRDAAGPRTATVSTDGLPPGVYLARLVAGDRQSVRPLTVVR